MSNSTSSNGNGTGTALLIIATVALAVLKLSGVISVSWWVVTSPLWIGFALLLLVLAVVAIAAAVGFCSVDILRVLHNWKHRRRR